MHTSAKSLLALALLAVTNVASAQLLDADYAATSTRIDFNPVVTDEFEGVERVNLASPFPFYGVDRSFVDISMKGNINFSSNLDFYTPQFPAGPAAIAPLWADWLANEDLAGTGVFYRQDANRLLVTWDVVLLDDESVNATFQAALYNDGFIEFGFGNVDPGYANFANDYSSPFQPNGNPNFVGVNAGNGNQSILFANPANASFYPVPEPGTMALLGGLVVLGGLAIRRRK